MKKIKLHMTRHELRILIGFLELSLHREMFPAERTGASKLVQACLAELLVRLNKVWDIFRIEFKFSITVAQGLALHEYVQQCGGFVSDLDTLTINKVIGIIDQKTA